MNIIKNYTKHENIVNKSKFICILKYIDNIDNLNSTFEEIKNEYKDANHYCYSYIIGNKIKFSDDGEPKGSAGLPIYNALKNYDLNNIICVVIRYFGGTKLGLGLLTRTYFNTVNETLKISSIEEYIKVKKVTVIFNYDIIDNIDYLVNEYILNKEFNDYVKYDLAIPISLYKNIIDNLKKYKIKIDED